MASVVCAAFTARLSISERCFVISNSCFSWFSLSANVCISKSRVARSSTSFCTASLAVCSISDLFCSSAAALAAASSCNSAALSRSLSTRANSLSNSATRSSQSFSIISNTVRNASSCAAFDSIASCSDLDLNSTNFSSDTCASNDILSWCALTNSARSFFISRICNRRLLTSSNNRSFSAVYFDNRLDDSRILVSYLDLSLTITDATASFTTSSRLLLLLFDELLLLKSPLARLDPLFPRDVELDTDRLLPSLFSIVINLYLYMEYIISISLLIQLRCSLIGFVRIPARI